MTTETAKHTPGRLEVRIDDAECIHLSSEDYGGIAMLHDPLAVEMGRTAELRANATRLAHCWNTHDALVEALGRILKTAYQGEPSRGWHDDMERALQAARVALAAE